jgi:6-phosphogluconolactonase
MGFQTDVLAGDYAEGAARRILEAFPGGGSFVLTGGTNAERIYPRLAGKREWADVTFCFSDERCVPPDDENSNYGMAKRLFLDAAGPGAVHRVKGELEPQEAAAEYRAEIRPFVEHGFDLLLLGMGADAHVGAMFPGSPTLHESATAAVIDRPDGMQGITLTPPAMLSARRVILIVTGDKKAEAVRRAVQGDESPKECPARVLADHPDATFLLDEPAASALQSV